MKHGIKIKVIATIGIGDNDNYYHNRVTHWNKLDLLMTEITIHSISMASYFSSIFITAY